MGFSQEAGYTPSSIEDIMASIMTNINTQFGTSYTAETFAGTNFYKYFYALAQYAQENEVKASEIFQKVTDYFNYINAQIINPKVTPNGIIEALLAEDYVASVKPMIEADAGKSYICVDVGETEFSTLTVQDIDYVAKVQGQAGLFTVAYTDTNSSGAASITSITDNDIIVSIEDGVTDADTIIAAIEAHAADDIVSVSTSSGASAQSAASEAPSTLSTAYQATKLAICELIKDYGVAGVVSQGTEVETITLTNGQAFDFKYNLPDRIETLLRLTITLSRNNQTVIGDPEETKLQLLKNIQAEYKLGKDFEPERYFTVSDAPWASDILLEYSINDGSTWLTDVYEADYDELLTISLENITLIEV